MSVHITFEESHGMHESKLGVVVYGPTNRVELKDELLAELPNPLGTLFFRSFGSMNLVPGYSDVWTGEVTYGAYEEKQELKAGENEFRFESVKEQYTQTVSPSSRCYVTDGDGVTKPWVPDDLFLIGWKSSARVIEGTPRTVYYRAFSWRVAVPFSVATESWRRQVDGLRGTVCSGTFFGYAAETCKMEDITGSVTGSGIYTFDISFIQKDHPGTMSIGGIVVPDVKAWEILDLDAQTINLVQFEGNSFQIPVVSQVKVHYLETVASWSILSDLLGV